MDCTCLVKLQQAIAKKQTATTLEIQRVLDDNAIEPSNMLT